MPTDRSQVLNLIAGMTALASLLIEMRTEETGVTDHPGWGIFASGWSRGSALTGNTLIDNPRGALNTWAAVGLQVSSADWAQQSLAI